MGARSGTHDDVVIALALAWFAAPECAPQPMRLRSPIRCDLMGTSDERCEAKQDYMVLMDSAALLVKVKATMLSAGSPSEINRAIR